MANLSIKTQGVRGGEPKFQENIAASTLFLHSEDRISVDVFEGQGNSYKRREREVIEIYENGKLLFSGNRYELFDILKGKKMNDFAWFAHKKMSEYTDSKKALMDGDIYKEFSETN